MTAPNYQDNCQKLLEQLNTRYHLKKVYLEIETYRFELIKVENLDELLDQVTDPAEIPFWSELWPASIGLATAILRDRAFFRGKTVLELGAGVGLAGIAASLAGARVTQSDFMKDAFDFIRVNSYRNGMVPNRFLLADWRCFPELAERFDFVIGADILYEKTLHDHLAAILYRVVRKDGCVWLTDPGRIHAQQFWQKQAESGWRICQTRIPVHFQENPYVIDLYQLALPGTL